MKPSLIKREMAAQSPKPTTKSHFAGSRTKSWHKSAKMLFTPMLVAERETWRIVQWRFSWRHFKQVLLPLLRLRNSQCNWWTKSKTAETCRGGSTTLLPNSSFSKKRRKGQNRRPIPPLPCFASRLLILWLYSNCRNNGASKVKCSASASQQTILCSKARQRTKSNGTRIEIDRNHLQKGCSCPKRIQRSHKWIVRLKVLLISCRRSKNRETMQSISKRRRIMRTSKITTKTTLIR